MNMGNVSYQQGGSLFRFGVFVLSVTFPNAYKIFNTPKTNYFDILCF